MLEVGLASAGAAERVGCIEELPTPALVFDGARVQANIDRLATYARSHGLGVRPHTKTHKSLKIAALQLAAGATGLTVAKVGEAEVMAALDADLLIAYPVFDPGRKARVAELARTRTVRVAVDSALAIQELAAAAAAAGTTVGLLVDLDVGMGRTGVPTPDAALELAQLIERTSHVRLDGIMCYPGHVWAPAAEQVEPLARVSAKLRETIGLWRSKGLEAGIVSGGSTPTAYQSHLIPELTEIRPGTYVFNDMNEVYGGFSTQEQCAAKIVVTVISNAVAGQVVVDAGSKTFTSDICVPRRESGHGLILGHPAARLVKLSEEHGQVDVTADPRPPHIGERLEIVPNHICPCVNLQAHAWWLHDDGSLERLTVDARGLLS
jgi:D-serine deaminase-like pyridoxal phosphate-dependent protein